MDPLLRQAIARIDIVQDGRSVAHGTGCLVTHDLVLTAMHVVADRSSSPLALIPGTITLTFPTQTCHATVVDGRWDPRSDWALVRCAKPPSNIRPVPLAESAGDHDEWETFGFPDANPRDGLAHVGTVSHAAGTFDGVAAYQLFSDQAAAGAGSPVKGLSGSPMIVDGGLAGVIRSSLIRDGAMNVAGTLYACPIGIILDRCDDLLPLPDPCRGLPSLPRMALPSPPFRFLERFTARDAEIFFGRNREIRQLYELVTTGSAPIVLLYGQSGSGKSSFLDAGVLPRLTSSHVATYVRREREKGLLQTAVDGLRQSQSVPQSAPHDLTTTWCALELAAAKPLILIVDQVEEAFTLRGADGEVNRFVEAVASMVSSASPKGRLVLAFRKEWLGEVQKALESHRLDYSKVFLQTLDRQAVAEVVGGLASTPRLREKYGLTVEAGLPAAMAAALTADRDSPVAPTLQVLLSRMWLDATAASGASPRFTAELYAGITRAGVLLTDFLGQQLAALAVSAKAAGGSVADVVESGLALDVLRFHVSRLGTAEERSRQALVDEYQRDDDVAWLVGELKRLYLLTEPAGDGAQMAATRLAHDTLGSAIRTRCDESLLPGQRARRVLEARAGEWADGRDGTPLDARDLARVEQGATGMRAWRPDEQRLIDASRKLRDADAARRRRLRYGSMAAALFVLIAGGAAWLFWARNQADRAWSELMAFGDSIPSILDMQPALGLTASIEAVDRGLELNAGIAPGTVPVALQENLALALDSARERLVWTLPAAVTATAMASDGRIAAATADNAIRLYRIGESEPAAVLPAAGRIVDLSFSSDGELLAAALNSGVAIWQRNGERISGLPVEMAARTYSARFIPGTQRLAVQQEAGVYLRYCVLEVGTRLSNCVVDHVPLLTAVPPPIAVARLDVDVALAATVVTDRVAGDRVALRRIEGTTLSPPTDFSGTEDLMSRQDDIRSVDIVRDVTGVWLAAAGRGRISILNLQDRLKGAVGIDVNTTFTRVRFDAHGHVFASSADGILRVYDRQGRQIVSPLNLANEVAGFAVSTDGLLVAAAGNGDRGARLSVIDMVGFSFSVPALVPAPRPIGESRSFRGVSASTLGFPWSRPAISFLPHGQVVVVGTDEHNGVWQLNVARGEALADARRVTGLASDVGGMMAADRAGRLYALSAAGLRQFGAGVEPGGRVVMTSSDLTTFAISPGGQTLVAADSNGGIVSVDPSNGRRIGEVRASEKPPSGPVAAMAVHPSGESFAVAFRGGSIRMFRKDGSEIASNVSPAGGATTALMFHPDGFLITGSDRGEVRRQRMENDTGPNQEWAVRAFPGGSVTGFALHPSGSALFVAGTQGMRAIDLHTGLALHLPDVPGNVSLRGIAISPDGRLLAGARDDGGFLFWRAGWRDWLAEGCERLRQHELFTIKGKPGITVDTIPGLGGIEPYNALNACNRLVWSAK